MTKFLTWRELAALPVNARVYFPCGYDIFPVCFVKEGACATVAVNDLNEIDPILYLRPESGETARALADWDGMICLTPAPLCEAWDDLSPVSILSTNAA